jgi:hypothetical protein
MPLIGWEMLSAELRIRLHYSAAGTFQRSCRRAAVALDRISILVSR